MGMWELLPIIRSVYIKTVRGETTLQLGFGEMGLDVPLLERVYLLLGNALS